jgi:hypothetical protein
MPKLILQPDDSSLCGQCCIAMAAGVSLRNVIKVAGDSAEGMTTEQMRAALLRFGIFTSRRMHPVGDRGLGAMRHGRAILHTRQRHRRTPKYGHWILLWDGGVFDPEGPYTAIYYPTTIVSYLKIHRAAGGPYVSAD